MLALTQLPSPRMRLCQRTFVAHSHIDYETVVRQHDGYCRVLEQCGLKLTRLDTNLNFPDGTFVEDTAIVLDELAVLAPMGTESRRGEPQGVARELSRYRRLYPVEPPAMLEGGDVLRVGRTLLVGMSSRTDQRGIDALDQIVRHYDYQVVPVPVRECLHLKTACTALPDGRLLINPDWVDPLQLAGFELVCVPHEEPWAANVLLVGERVCMAASHAQTAEMVRSIGFDVTMLPISEFAKVEGGVTCLSIVFEPHCP